MKTTKHYNSNGPSHASRVRLLGGFGCPGRFSAQAPTGGMFSGDRHRVASERRPVSAEQSPAWRNRPTSGYRAGTLG